MSDVSKSLISLTKNEQMSELLIFLSESLIRSFWTKNEQFAWKSNELIPIPDFYVQYSQSDLLPLRPLCVEAPWQAEIRMAGTLITRPLHLTNFFPGSADQVKFRKRIRKIPIPIWIHETP